MAIDEERGGLQGPIFWEDDWILDRMPDASAMILVAILPEPRDLEIARVFGWYRIPLRSAPRLVTADYLAFYQPGSFGEAHRWRIEFIAPVLGHELTTRRALLLDEMDHPRAEDAYYKMQLAGLIALPTPILAGRWKRVTFFFTTGEYLLQARTLAELVVASEERRRLWLALRERVRGSQHYQVAARAGPDLDKDTLNQLFDLVG